MGTVNQGNRRSSPLRVGLCVCVWGGGGGGGGGASSCGCPKPKLLRKKGRFRETDLECQIVKVFHLKILDFIINLDQFNSFQSFYKRLFIKTKLESKKQKMVTMVFWMNCPWSTCRLKIRFRQLRSCPSVK